MRNHGYLYYRIWEIPITTIAVNMYLSYGWVNSMILGHRLWAARLSCIIDRRVGGIVE